LPEAPGAQGIEVVKTGIRDQGSGIRDQKKRARKAEELNLAKKY
jgi:hypothetical protein